MPVKREDFEEIIRKLSTLMEADELMITLIVLTDKFNDENIREEMSFVVLKSLLEKDKEFLDFVRRFTVAKGDSESISQAVKEMTDCYSLQSNNSHRDSAGLMTLEPTSTMTTLLTTGLAKALYSLPCELRAEIISKFSSYISSMAGDIIQLDTCLDSSMKALGIFKQNAPAVLSMVYVSYVALRAIYKWWTGEYSGARCVQQIITSIATMAAGCGGCMLGISLASGTGPYGMVVAGALGGIIVGTIAAKVAEYSTLWLFDLPKDIAVEKAYQFLGLTKSATNGEINESFACLCRQYDPRRPTGSQEKFVELQMHMAKIKVARGEIFD